MVLAYDKDNQWEINSPSVLNLLVHITECLNKFTKKYMSIKDCAKLIYVMNQSVNNWTDDDYLEFLKKSPNNLITSYTTVMKSSKGERTIINRENVNVLKKDFEFLRKLLSHILACMVLDSKKKLYFFEKKLK